MRKFGPPKWWELGTYGEHFRRWEILIVCLVGVLASVVNLLLGVTLRRNVRWNLDAVRWMARRDMRRRERR